MMKFYKIMFFCSLILGTLTAISSYSWMSMWIGLEINLLSIIPLLKDSNNVFPSESALKYFIIQVLASIIFLFSIIMILNYKEFIPQNSLFLMIMNSALFIKMGAAPFHAWFPEVMEGLNWMNCLIMLTWQKIAPMILLMYNFKMTIFSFNIIVFSTIVGSIMGLNQISLRKILAYSSITHISWMLSSMLSLQNIWFIYFSIYSMINLNIILIFWKLNIFYLKQLYSVLNLKKFLKLLFISNFLSLGGLPPFWGFLSKWLTILSLIEKNFIFLMFILLIFTLISLYFYLRISFSTFTIYSNEMFMETPQNPSFLMIMLNFLSLSGLLTSILIFSIL